MSPEFLLIRHAQSEWNADGRWQGHADPPLSPRGRAQAQELASNLRGERVDRLVCSDLCRALSTAEALAPVLECLPQPDVRYRERIVTSGEDSAHGDIDEPFKRRNDVWLAPVKRQQDSLFSGHVMNSSKS